MLKDDIAMRGDVQGEKFQMLPGSEKGKSESKNVLARFTKLPADTKIRAIAGILVPFIIVGLGLWVSRVQIKADGPLDIFPITVLDNVIIQPTSFRISNEGGTDATIVKYSTTISFANSPDEIVIDNVREMSTVITGLPSGVKSLSFILLPGKQVPQLIDFPEHDEMLQLPFTVKAHTAVDIRVALAFEFPDAFGRAGVDSDEGIDKYIAVMNQLDKYLPCVVSYEFKTETGKKFSSPGGSCFEGVFMFTLSDGSIKLISR